MNKNLLIFLCTIFLNANLVAQNVGIGTATPQASFTVAANKTALFGADTLNAGTKLMWLPSKGAFRVGNVTGVNWNTDSIGKWSFASGYDTKAKGDFSTAMGVQTSASGDRSTAMGYWSTASDYDCVAMGFLTTASGLVSTAMGDVTLASGISSTAMGNFTIASGNQSTAMGSNSHATADNSTAMGHKTIASGSGSTSLGEYTTAKAYGSLAIGIYNDTIAGSNSTLFIDTDPLFYVGNGTAYNKLHNALVVYKNGNTDINGYTQLGKVSEAAPKIKMKELLVTSSRTSTGQEGIDHGLNASKIISVTTLLEWTPGYFAPVEYSPDPLLRYNYFVSPTQIIIQNNAATCAYICRKPVKVVITYKE